MNIEGVLFDYGHTLAYLPNVKRTHEVAAKNVQRLVKNLGVKAVPSRITELINDYAHGPKDVVSIQEEFSQILRMLGVDSFNDKNLQTIISSHGKPYIQNARIRRGARELLEQLRNKDTKIGIVANSAGVYMINPVLKREKIQKSLDVVIASVAS